MKVLNIPKLRIILDKIEAGNQIDIYENDMIDIYKTFGDTAYYDRDSCKMEITEKGPDIENIITIQLN